MRIIETNFRVILLFVVLQFNSSVVKADSIFDSIRAFTPEESIRQMRITDSVRAMTLPGRGGNASSQIIDASCRLSNPGAANGGVCCTNESTGQCTFALNGTQCPTSFFPDVNYHCDILLCNNPASPSPSPSASPSRSPAQSPSLAPSLRPGQCLCKPKGTSDSQDNCTIRSGICVRDEGGRQLESCESTKNRCNVPSPSPSAAGPLRCACKREGLPDWVRDQYMCVSKVGVCDEDDRGQKLESCDKNRKECDPPPPPPPVTRSPVSTRSAVVVRSGTPTRSGTPSLTRTPSRSASGTPYPTYTPFPSRTASVPKPTVTVIASKSTATN